MKRNAFIVIAFAAFALALGACHKATYSTTYTITPKVQFTNTGPEVLRDSVVAYGIDGDTTTWKIASFDDALNGVFTNYLTGEQRNADRVAVYNDADTTLTLELDKEWSMVVVCNYADSIYGYRNVQIGYNMPSLSSLIKFRPWKLPTAYPYSELNWRMRLGRQPEAATE